MLLLLDDLTTLTEDRLYQVLDDLRDHRERDGRGRTPEAAHVRLFCREEGKRVKAELKRRGLPTSRPDDTRRYGPGRTAWQRAGVSRR